MTQVRDSLLNKTGRLKLNKRTYYIFVVLLLSSSPVFAQASEGFLTHGEYQYGLDPTGAWKSFEGPFRFLDSDYKQHRFATVRYQLPGKSALGEQPAIFLWRYSMNAHLRLNGEIISAEGKLDPPTRNLHRPQLVALPSRLLKEDVNWLDVQLAVVPGFGYVLPPVLGQLDALQPQYEFRYFSQITVSQMIFGLTILLGLMGLLLWLFDTSQTKYLYFGLASFCWSIYSLNPFVGDLFIPMNWWLYLLHICIDLFALSILLFTHRFFGVTYPRIERVAVGLVCLAAVTYPLIEEVVFAFYSTLVHLGAFAMLVYCAGRAVQLGVLKGRRDAWALLVCYGVFLLLGVHDAVLTSMESETLWKNSFFMANLGVPILLLTVSVQLVWQLQRSNAYRELALQEAQEELRASYTAQERLLEKEAASAERERIYRDLHDEVGAKLLDLVYLTEEEHAQIARDALHEIRSIGESSTSSRTTLGAWSSQLRAEVAQRLEQHGMNLHWDATLDEQASHLELSSEANYQLSKVMRELVTNAVKHAQAQNIWCNLRVNGELHLVVTDDGVGVRESSDQAGGTGLLSIDARIAGLGGTFEVVTPERGFAVAIRLPLPAAPLNRG